MALAILWSHGISMQRAARRETLRLSMLSLQLFQLAEAGFRITTADDLCPYQPSIALTFDEAESTLLDAVPTLLAARAKASIFVTTGRIGAQGFLDKSQLRELAAQGFLIGTHGETHRFWTSLDDRELAAELQQSKRQLEEILGSAVTLASAPGGRVDARVRQAAHHAGFGLLYTRRPGIASLHNDILDLPRIRLNGQVSPSELVAQCEGSFLPLAAKQLRYQAGIVGRSVLGEARYQQLRGLVR